MRSLSFIACSFSVLVACSGTDFKGIDAATDSPSGSDGSSMEGGGDSSASDSGTDSGRMDGGPGMCPTCNDGFICCMSTSSGNYMKCTAKNCLACCMQLERQRDGARVVDVNTLRADQHERGTDEK